MSDYKSSTLSRRTFLKAPLATGVALAALHSRAYAIPRRGWIELFNGRNLDGWHLNPEKIGHGTGGQWTVEKGAIQGQQDPPGSGNGGILLTDRKFENFVLEIDMRPDWGVCSGLFLRSNDRGQCFQMMVDYHDAGNVGQIYGEGTTGFNTRTFDINGEVNDDGDLQHLTTDKHQTASAVGLVSTCSPAQWIKAWKVNQWNTARVIVEGDYPVITTYLNQQQICVFDGNNSNSDKYDKDRIHKMLGTSGSIAVQVHGGTGWPAGACCRWKNIRIKPL
ncbi:MAG: DUF1080 domain-containing protein [Planctomycetota bacterium]|nr:DUF1080 domain-containing protein [Planctomycetota bacterium]